jgi:simple sugar transport system ATP-binding protein/ribose transport system ATP-binding protein
MPAPIITLRGIDKTFEGTHALAGVDIDIAPGTVHALVGENGAGKSTLGKILAGVYTPNAGQITIDDEVAHFENPHDALAHGVTIVAQEIALVGTRPVVENVFLGSELHRGPFVRKRTLRRRFDELVAATGIHLPPETLVDDLSIADQQKVEILRALARKADVIVMDEPTARLATHEAEALMGIFGALRGRGKTIVFVSHFLEEVLAISDRITVLRDGRLVRTDDSSAFTHATLIEAMIGRSLESTFPQKSISSTSERLLDVRDLSRSGAFEDISFTVDRGEIVVLTGLVGSGRSEVVRAIYGIDPPTAGSVTFRGRDASYRHPSAAIRAGMALIPESRKTEGLFVDFSLTDNVVLPHLSWFSRAGLVSRAQALAGASGQLKAVGVKASSPGIRAGLLSGGNQQKVLFARSLLTDLGLLIADEPTRGVDVGAKRQIYELVVAQADRGMGVLLVSSEMEEVIGLAHKVLVMRQGRMVGQLSGSDITDQQIANLAFGQPERTTDLPEEEFA